MEEKAWNTLENAIYVEPILRRLGCRQAVLLTSDFHMPRAALLFEGAFAHMKLDVHLLCLSAASGHPRLPPRQPRPWQEGGPQCDISSWHMAERCEHEALLLRCTMPKWFRAKGFAMPSAERFAQAALQLKEIAAATS